MITCLICNKTFKQLDSHLRFKHNISSKDYCKKYNVKSVISEESKNNISIATSRAMHTKKVQDHIKESWTEERREYISKKSSDRLKNTWKNKNNKDIFIDCLNRGREKTILNNKFGKKCIEYKEYKMRSKYELDFAKMLDLNHINYSYEDRYFEYFYNNKHHKYFPDFYLKDYNLFIEVKPLKFIDAELNKVKKESVLTSGYIIKYITEEHLYINKDFDIFKFIYEALSGN